MIFTETPLAGAFVIDVEPAADERGIFARTFSRDEFEEYGLNPDVVQCNTSFNAKTGTLRGMHYQAAPHGECKLVRCTRGSIYDVIIDLRRDSPTYCGWFAVELTVDNRRALYIPEGLAHGFQTLEDASEVLYQMSERYAPSHARGVRWDDPAFGIRWPDAKRTMSEKDASYPYYRP
jgi:dTDP-4-dehydrorhamnose 3,5-epimerase